MWAGGGMSGGAARRYVAAALGRCRARGLPLWEPLRERLPGRGVTPLGTGGAAAAAAAAVVLPLLPPLPPRRHLSSR